MAGVVGNTSDRAFSGSPFSWAFSGIFTPDAFDYLLCGNQPLDWVPGSEKHGRGYGPSECSEIPIMPKHDHHKAAAHHDEAAKSHRDAAVAHEEGDTERASQHSQIANDHSKKAQEASNAAHRTTKGPKTL